MPILIFCGLMGLIAIPFLLFCHRGFARAKNVLRNRKQGGNVFPLGYHRGRRQPSLLVLGLLLIPTMAMVAQNSSHPPYVANNPASCTSTVNSDSPQAAAVSASSGTPVIGAPDGQSYPLMQTIDQNWSRSKAAVYEEHMAAKQMYEYCRKKAQQMNKQAEEYEAK